MHSSQVPNLHRREADFDENSPFSGDMFDRNDFAERLTQALPRFPDGGVIAIDAAWGEGKSWFVRNWQAHLEMEQFITVSVDAFQQDYIEDPFSMIAGALLSKLPNTSSQKKRKFLETALNVTKVLAPVVVKAISGAAIKVIVGVDASAIADATRDAIEAEADDVLSKLLSKRLAEYESDKATIERFRTALQEVAESNDKPLVVFIDELDRCRPDFAVKTIERIKHFFDVKGVVFVLALNRKQLVASINGIYGASVDGNAYLGKFIHFSVGLPRKNDIERYHMDDNYRFCIDRLEKLGFGKGDRNHHFAFSLSRFGSLFQMTLRDIERAIVLYGLAPEGMNPAHKDLLAWPIAVKIARYDLFEGVLHDRDEDHLTLAKLLAPLKKDSPLPNLDTFLMQSHAAVGQRNDSQLREVLESFGGPAALRQLGPKFLHSLFKAVDLDVTV